MDALFNDFWSMASQWISPLEPYHGSDVTASLGGTTDYPVMSKNNVCNSSTPERSCFHDICHAADCLSVIMKNELYTHIYAFLKAPQYQF